MMMMPTTTTTRRDDSHHIIVGGSGGHHNIIIVTPVLRLTTSTCTIIRINFLVAVADGDGIDAAAGGGVIHWN